MIHTTVRHEGFGQCQVIVSAFTKVAQGIPAMGADGLVDVNVFSAAWANDDQGQSAVGAGRSRGWDVRLAARATVLFLNGRWGYLIQPLEAGPGMGVVGIDGQHIFQANAPVIRCFYDLTEP
jgi:hypothetical protein